MITRRWLFRAVFSVLSVITDLFACLRSRLATASGHVLLVSWVGAKGSFRLVESMGAPGAGVRRSARSVAGGGSFEAAGAGPTPGACPY